MFTLWLPGNYQEQGAAPPSRVVPLRLQEAKLASVSWQEALGRGVGQNPVSPLEPVGPGTSCVALSWSLQILT